VDQTQSLSSTASDKKEGRKGKGQENVCPTASKAHKGKKGRKKRKVILPPRKEGGGEGKKKGGGGGGRARSPTSSEEGERNILRRERGENLSKEGKKRSLCLPLLRGRKEKGGKERGFPRTLIERPCLPWCPEREKKEIKGKVKATSIANLKH